MTPLETPVQGVPTPAAWNDPRRAGVLLVLLGLLAYCNSFFKPFQLDDMMYLFGVDYIKNFGEAYQNLNNRPVIAATFFLNQIATTSIVGYHAVNVAIHVLAGLTLFGLVRRTLLLPRWQERFESRATVLAFVIAALWLVHPLNTSAVTYLIQRCESLMGLFYLLCFYTLLRGATSEHPWRWYGPGIVAGILGSGCKEPMVTAPFLLLLYDRTFLASSWREVLRRRWLAHAGYFLILVFPLSIRLPFLFSGATGSTGFAVPGIPSHQYLMTQPGVLLHYLRLAFLPVGLSIDYRDWHIVRVFSESIPTAIPILLLLAVTAYGALRARWWGFLGAWFFGILSLTSSIVALFDVCCEYRMYLPLCAVITLVVMTVYSLGQRVLTPRRAVVGATILTSLAIATLTVLTMLRNDEYHSPEALWESVLTVRPKNYKAYVHLAEAHQREGRVEEAERFQKLSFAHLKPSFLMLTNYGTLLIRKGEAARGMNMLEASLDLDGTNTRILALAGRLHYALGPAAHPATGPSTIALLATPDLGPLLAASALVAREEVAVKYLERAIEKSPRLAMAHYHLATILHDRSPNDPEQQRRAQEHLAIAKNLDPNWVDIIRRDTNLFLRKGVYDSRPVYQEALFLAKEANFATDYKNPDLLFTLGWAYETLGDREQARLEYQKALAIAEESNHSMVRILKEKLAKR